MISVHIVRLSLTRICYSGVCIIFTFSSHVISESYKK